MNRSLRDYEATFAEDAPLASRLALIDDGPVEEPPPIRRERWLREMFGWVAIAVAVLGLGMVAYGVFS